MEDFSKILFYQNLKPEEAVLLDRYALDPEFLFFKTIRMGADAEVNSAFWGLFWGVGSRRVLFPMILRDLHSLGAKQNCLFILFALITCDKYLLDLFKSFGLNQMQGTVKFNDLSSPKQYLVYSLLNNSGSIVSIWSEAETGYTCAYVTFEHVLRNTRFGRCFGQLLRSRIKVYINNNEPLNHSIFKQTCEKLGINTVFGITFAAFNTWTRGIRLGGYIARTTIKNFLCLQDVNIDFGKLTKEIYFLGENGDGKTLLLEALLLTYSGNKVREQPSKTGNASTIFFQTREDGASLVGEDNMGAIYGTNNPNDIHQIFAYGTHRGRISGQDEEFDRFGFLSLFDANRILTNPSVWIKDYCTRGLGSIDEMTDEEFRERNDIARARKDELQEVFDYLLDRKIQIDIDKDDGKVKYIENGAKLTFEQLSEGYRIMLIFICDLLFRLSDNKIGYVRTWGRNARAVVLIDEIDEHLHPRWQRTIVSKLRELFPNVQFIMTTHSPHIIQGASDDAVIFRVYREDGKTCVSEAIKRSELDYMMINTLATSPLFGLESARLKVDDNVEYTTQTYLMERIERVVSKKIKEERENNGKSYLSEEEINKLIEDAWVLIDAENNK